MPEPKLTWSEKLQVARIEARGLRRAVAGITDQPDVDRQVEAIYERARKRAAKNK